MKKYLRIVTIAFISIAILNCGGKDDKKTNAPVVSKKKKEKVKKDSNVINLFITADDAMQFNTKELKAKAGKKVKLTLKHTGKMDANIMGHNVVILKQGTDAAAFAAKAATDKDNAYITKGTNEVIAYTDMIGGGQITTIEFDAPKVGTYDFICSFPAHFALMKGKFIVE